MKSVGSRVAALVPTLAVCLALAGPDTAAATPSCTFDPGADLLQVDLSASGDAVDLNVRSGEIRVFNENANPSAQVTCSGGTPTVTTTDSVFVIDGSDLPGGAAQDGNTRIGITAPTDFAPGEDAEAGHPANIEFVLNPNNGFDDELFMFGTEGPDSWELGNDGFNWNAAADTASPDDEMVLSNPTLFDEVSINTSGGDDTITARGGFATGSPLNGPEQLSLIGGPAADQIIGGDGEDFIGGDEGNDTMQGFGSHDILRGFTGTDTYGGGAGNDRAVFTSAPTGVTVDLGQAGAQDTGEGTDTFAGIESLTGSNNDDTLIGSGGSNEIEGSGGSDVLDGRGGTDGLDGGEPGFDDALDRVTYAQAPAAVTVDLAAGSAAGGNGPDLLTGIEDLTGSPFADTLTGSAASNSITGLGGTDTVSALAGTDRVDVRDGEADTASCGSEIDSATADRASLDTVNADCETTSFLPEPTPEPEPGGGEPPAADTNVAFDLSGKAKQRVLKQSGVVVTASCPLEDCAVEFGGKVKPRAEDLAAAATEKLTLKLKRKQLRAIARALRAGKKPTVKVDASVTDAAGNVAKDGLTVRAK